MTMPNDPTQRSRRPAAWPAAVLIALAAACFSRLVGDPAALIVDGARPSVDHANPSEPRPLGNDLTFLFLPHHLFIWNTIGQTGRVPMWDPTGFGGRPMLGNPQAGLCYPPVWLVWYFGVPSALGWLTVAHLIWGGLGTYVLARLYGLSRPAATVAGGCFEAAPYLLGHVFEGHYPHIWGVCWFPWAFWAFDSRRLNRWLGTAALPLITALVYVVGHPQEGFLIGLALTFRAFVDWMRSRPREGVLVRWIGVMLVASGIAAIDLVPQIAIGGWKLDTSASGDAASEVSGRYSLRLVNLWQLVSPEAVGGPADYDGYDNSWETMLSFGMAPLALALAAILLRWDQPTVRGWAILAGLTLWVAGGYKLGLQALLHHLVPGASFFRAPARSLFLTSLGVALLAGFGVDALRSALDWRRLGRVLLAAAVGLSIVSALVVLKASRRPAATASPAIGSPRPETAAPSPRDWGREARTVARVVDDPRVWVLVAGIAALVGLGSLKSRWDQTRWVACGLGLLAFLELGSWGRSLLQVAPARQFLGPDPVAEAIHQARTEANQPPARLKTKDSFYSDLRAISNGLEKTNINDSFQLGHAAILYQQLYPVPSHAQLQPQHRRPEAPLDQAVDEYRRAVRQRVFDLMAVDHLVTDRVEPDLDWPVLKSGRWDGQSSYVIQANPTALPRAYVVGHADVVEPDLALALSQFRTTDPRQRVLMLSDPLADLPAAAVDRQPFTPARWSSTDPDHPRLTVTTRKPGLLVIADTWMPGWSARVDGKPVEVLRGNDCQRVIPIREPGPHTVSLDYTPPGIYLGTAIFLGTLGIWTFVSIRAGRRRADSPTPSRGVCESTIPASASS
jgi:hypothetical protein